MTFVCCLNRYFRLNYIHRQQSITHFTQKFSFIKSTQILSERHFESLQCFYFFTYHQYVMKFFFLLFFVQTEFFHLCQGVFGEIFTVQDLLKNFSLFYANSDFPLWKFVRKISKIRRWKNDIIRIFISILTFFSFFQFPFSVHEILSKKNWIPTQRILFKMVYLKWVHDWKWVKPRSKSNKILYVLIEIHKTMLTNSDLTECRKKPISMYVVQFQWNFHVASCHPRKKIKTSH